jgi:hypothetical protein
MNKIELINKHAEVVGGIKKSFALQDDMVESNIFLPHLWGRSECVRMRLILMWNLTKKKTTERMLLECDHADILHANKSDSKVRENAGNATIFLPHLGEVRLVLLRGDVC